MNNTHIQNNKHNKHKEGGTRLSEPHPLIKHSHPEYGVRARITSRAPPGGAVPECQQR